MTKPDSVIINLFFPPRFLFIYVRERVCTEVKGEREAEKLHAEPRTSQEQNPRTLGS